MGFRIDSSSASPGNEQLGISGGADTGIMSLDTKCMLRAIESISSTDSRIRKEFD